MFQGTWMDDQQKALIDCQVEIDKNDGTIKITTNQCQHERTSDLSSKSETYQSPDEAGAAFTEFLKEGYREKTTA